MIYRRFRDWSLEESFIKVLWSYIYIASTVVWPNGKTLIEIDTEPSFRKRKIRIRYGRNRIYRFF